MKTICYSVSGVCIKQKTEIRIPRRRPVKTTPRAGHTPKGAKEIRSGYLGAAPKKKGYARMLDKIDEVVKAAFIRKTTVGGYKVLIMKSNSPIAPVLHTIICQDEVDMNRTYEHLMKQLGRSYGGDVG